MYMYLMPLSIILFNSQCLYHRTSTGSFERHVTCNGCGHESGDIPWRCSELSIKASDSVILSTLNMNLSFSFSQKFDSKSHTSAWYQSSA
jgi:hypothetical protein